MKNYFYFLTLIIVACTSTKPISTSATARKELEERFENKIGVATKMDFVEQFGPENWCRPTESGEETCRFYKKLPTQWMGEKNDRTHRNPFDEVTVDFDTNGKLKTFKANALR